MVVPGGLFVCSGARNFALDWCMSDISCSTSLGFVRCRLSALLGMYALTMVVPGPYAASFAPDQWQLLLAAGIFLDAPGSLSMREV